MNIKEIETRSGLTRANVRFYEAEGLLHPARGENGYRDYSEEDLALLLRVRLLRTLGVGLAEIRALIAGSATLTEVLSGQEETLRRRQREDAIAEQVCRQMEADGAAFADLDSRRYLAALEHPDALKEDALPRVKAPWQRFWARELDLLTWVLLFVVGEGVLLQRGLLDAGASLFSTGLDRLIIWLLVLVAIALVEPLELHFFGTTLGKWIFGLRVTDIDGNRLTTAAARERTTQVLVSGLGLNIPLVRLFFLWRSYRRCADGLGELAWEADTVLVQRDARPWRYAAAMLAAAALLALGT
ncbi:MAG: MerR family transcriptional regulator, partial [Oscillospiraceae bacterium]|nr:MerR family transcriptional regulator [Oscillospiraceae bacterium]